MLLTFIALFFSPIHGFKTFLHSPGEFFSMFALTNVFIENWRLGSVGSYITKSSYLAVGEPLMYALSTSLQALKTFISTFSRFWGHFRPFREKEKFSIF